MVGLKNREILDSTIHTTASTQRINKRLSQCTTFLILPKDSIRVSLGVPTIATYSTRSGYIAVVILVWHYGLPL